MYPYTALTLWFEMNHRYVVTGTVMRIFIDAIHHGGR
jgi:hypothetical protein